MNKCIFVGRLTRDPETRYSQGENATAITRFSIAVNRRFKNHDGNYEADFPNCVCYGKTAEFVNQYFKKGMAIGIVGRLATGSYTNKDGVKVYTTDVVADDIEFAESKSASAGADAAYADNFSRPEPSAAAGDGFMNIPDGVEDEGLPFN